MAEPTRDDEALLIARSQQGEVQAFNQLVEKYQQITFTVIYRMLGDRDVAADITQDVFIAAFRNIQSYRGGASFRAWLLRIASNQVYDHWRRVQRHPVDSLDALTEEDEPHSAGILSSLVETREDANPETALLTQELQDLLQHGLRLLPLDQRIAVVLCDIQGFSYEEIATTTESTLGTVRSRISRGRARLRNHLIKNRELLPRNYRLYTDKD